MMEFFIESQEECNVERYPIMLASMFGKFDVEECEELYKENQRDFSRKTKNNRLANFESKKKEPFSMYGALVDFFNYLLEIDFSRYWHTRASRLVTEYAGRFENYAAWRKRYKNFAEWKEKIKECNKILKKHDRNFERDLNTTLSRAGSEDGLELEGLELNSYYVGYNPLDRLI